MTATALKWVAVAASLALATAFGWAVALSPKPDSAPLRPKVAGLSPVVRPSAGPPQTITYVS